MVRYLQANEIGSVYKLALQAEPLFGKMVGEKEFEDTIKKCIDEKAIICHDDGNEISGAVIVNRHDNEIAWLVVDDQKRGLGIGEKLLIEAIRNLDINRNIYVQTFSSSEQSGIAAKKLYEKNGFVYDRDAGLNPAGISTVIMRLSPTTM